MEPHIQDRIVKISVPAEGSTNLYWHFTGYVLCDGLILTCRHGFTADDRRFDDQRLIKVVCQSGKINEEIDFSGCQFSEIVPSDDCQDGKPVLYASQDFDIALLSCPNVKAVYHPIKPLRDGAWKSGGFPEFNVAGEANGFELFGGTHLGCKNEGCYLSISVVEPELKNDAHWAMASGSPIFVGNNLVAVLKEYRPAANGSFVVGYLQRLWDRNDGFQEIIKKHVPVDFSYPRLEVKNMLESDSYRCLGKELSGFVSNPDRESLVDYLFSLEELALIELFQRLSVHSKQSAKPLLILLLSAAFEDPLMESCNSSQQPYHNVNVAYPASCEFLMAAHDNRSPDFREGDLLNPRYSVVTVESGIQSSFNENFAKDLLNGRANLAAVSGRILADYPSIPGFDFEESDEIQRAQEILKYQQESYYWPVALADKRSDSFAEVIKVFPKLRVLNRVFKQKDAAKEAVLIKQVNEFLKD